MEKKEPSKRIRVVAALIVKDQRVLVARRSLGGPFGGKWEFPGGKVREGEDDRSALKREIREELGIDVEVGECAEVSAHDYPSISVNVAFYHCRQVNDSEPKCLEHLEIRWSTREELSSFDWLDADLELIQRLQSGDLASELARR